MLRNFRFCLSFFIAMALGFSPRVDSEPQNYKTTNLPNYGYYNYDVLDEAGNKAGSYKFTIRKTNVEQNSSDAILWKIKSRFVNQSILEVIDIVHDGKKAKSFNVVKYDNRSRQAIHQTRGILKNEEWLLNSQSNGKNLYKRIRIENFDIIEKIASRTLDRSFLPSKNKSKQVIQLNPTNLDLSQVTIEYSGAKKVNVSNKDYTARVFTVWKDGKKHQFSRLEGGITYSAENDSGSLILKDFKQR